MSELEDRLNSILSDPEQMARIQGLAQSLMGEGGAAPASPSGAAGEADSALLGKLGALLGQQGGDAEKRALLEAMKPYLSEKRRSKLDRAMRLARLARAARLAMGELGNGETL
ncbi:MAG: hypothetical protein IKH34_03810 [Oscillospiraceae bacterium]|nr:hypothetical protein [Oscillospiraceae bacterium]